MKENNIPSVRDASESASQTFASPASRRSGRSPARRTLELKVGHAVTVQQGHMKFQSSTKLLVTSRYCRVLPYFQPNRDNAAFRSIPLVFLFLFFSQLELLQGDLSVLILLILLVYDDQYRGPRYGYFETKPTFWSGEKWQYNLGSTPCFDEETRSPRLYVSTLELVIFDPLKKPSRRLRPWKVKFSTTTVTT